MCPPGRRNAICRLETPFLGCTRAVGFRADTPVHPYELQCRGKEVPPYDETPIAPPVPLGRAAVHSFCRLSGGPVQFRQHLAKPIQSFNGIRIEDDDDMGDARRGVGGLAAQDRALRRFLFARSVCDMEVSCPYVTIRNG